MEPPNRIGVRHDFYSDVQPFDSSTSEPSLLSRLRRVLRFNSAPERLSSMPAQLTQRAYSAPQLTEQSTSPAISELIETHLIEQTEQFAQYEVHPCIESIIEEYYVQQGFPLLLSLVKEAENTFRGSKQSSNLRAEKAEFLGSIAIIINSQDVAENKLNRLREEQARLHIKLSASFSVISDCITKLCTLRDTYSVLLTAVHLYMRNAPEKRFGGSYPGIRALLNKAVALQLAPDFLLVAPSKVSESMNPAGNVFPSQILIHLTDVLDRYSVKIDPELMTPFYLQLFEEISSIIPTNLRSKFCHTRDILSAAINGYFEMKPTTAGPLKQRLEAYFELFPLLRVLPLFSQECLSSAKTMQSTIYQPLRDCQELDVRQGCDRGIRIVWNSAAGCLEYTREWEDEIYLNQTGKLIATTNCMCTILLPLEKDVKIKNEFRICECTFAENATIEDIKVLCKVIPECMAKF